MIADRYKLLEPIGEGGMDSVWMVRAAVHPSAGSWPELIKAGMDSRAVLARFDAERQALAMMGSPQHRARVDGGTTDRGHPWFAMELVRGLPLTQYCDQRRMSVRNRLELFHANLLRCPARPSKRNHPPRSETTNVLITEHDGKPLPKVIDFGLAKALGGAPPSRPNPPHFLRPVAGTTAVHGSRTGCHQLARCGYACRHLRAWASSSTNYSPAQHHWNASAWQPRRGKNAAG